MKIKLISVFLLIATTLVGTAHARPSVPVINIENISLTTGSGKAPTPAQVKQSIVRAGDATQWQVAEGTNGRLTATLNVRNKHNMTIDIPYTTTQYSLLYKSSINMNYEVLDGMPVIHPNYNKWVQNLSNAIRIEMQKL